MHLKHAYRSLPAIVGLLFFSGCYAPYGAYPPGAYPPQGGVPTQFQGVPQSSYVMPGDGMGSPSSGVVAPQSTFAPSGNLQAPNPTARGGGGSSPSPVPPPRDPDPSAQRPTPVGEQTSQLRTASGPPQATLREPAKREFQSPIVLTSADDQSAGRVIAASGESTSGSPSGRDQNDNWFQGRLEFVEADRAWHLTYDDSPTAFDQLGGDITLSGNVKLDLQANGRRVRVTGKFDDTKLDRLQKPVFRVSQIDPL